MANDRSAPAAPKASDASAETTPFFRCHPIVVDDLSIQIVEAGEIRAPAFLFLHGWPQSSFAFQSVMGQLYESFHVVAMDLPGIGGSRGAPATGDKLSLSKIVEQVLDTLQMKNVVLVGHDVGGQITFAAARRLGEQDHIRPYFDYFYAAIAARRVAISEQARAAYVEAYARPEALKAGFDSYRAFKQDETDNSGVVAVETPTLCLRGDHEFGKLDDYVEGLLDCGFSNVTGGLIEAAGDFTPEENPTAFVAYLSAFHPGARRA